MTVPIPKPSADVYPSERVSRLRERIIHAPREACVERARYLTRSMSAGWNEHPLTRMSQAFAEILDNISVIIREDELIVGCRTSRLKGAPFFPENKSRWIEGDVDRFEERVIQKVRIGDAEARELKEEILPFWRGRTAEERFEELLPADVAEAMDKFVFTMMLEITYGIGHFTMNHRRILERGLCGIIAEARGKLEAMAAGERAGDRGLFYEAVIRSLAAAGTHQDRVIEALQQMLDELARWDDYRRFHREIGRLRREQKELADGTSEVGRRTATRPLKDLPPQERADLKGLQRGQLELARQLDRVQTAMEQTGNRLQQDDPLAGQTVIDAVEALLDAEGLDVLDPFRRRDHHPGNFARPRRFEIAAALCRLRSVRFRPG